MQTDVEYNASYDSAFHSSRRRMTLVSARRILRLMHDVVPFTSVSDFGCGSGARLSVAIDELGVPKAYGIEGPWMTSSALDNAPISFQPLD